MRRLLISALPGDLQMAWLEARELQDYLVLREESGPRVGARYMGRISAVDKGLGAAFVELGLEHSGLLPLEDLPRGMAEGSALLIEVARAAQAGKGPRLRTKGLTQPAGEMRDSGKIPRLIDAGPEELERAVQRAGQEEIDEIVVDDLAAFKRVKAILATFDGAFRGPVTLHRAMPGKGSGLFAAHDLEERLDGLLRPEVTLPSGAKLRIEPTQTLVAVDVDSAESRQRGKAARRALAINREAAEVLAQELRLRALSGLIVIDFLALQEASARKTLEGTLRQAFASDPARTRFFPMRPSGLLDMTRQRIRRPLHEIMGEPCGSLSSGWRLSAASCAFAALRRLRDLPATEKARAWCLRAPGAVLAALEGPARLAREAVESELGRPLDLAAREAYDPAGNHLWDIVPA